VSVAENGPFRAQDGGEGGELYDSLTLEQGTSGVSGKHRGMRGEVGIPCASGQAKKGEEHHLAGAGWGCGKAEKDWGVISTSGKEMGGRT